MSVGAAVDADLAAIRALLTASGLPLDGLGDVPSETLVARADDEVAGCAVIEGHGRFALLRSVAVAPDRRASGVGRVLATSALERARQAGFSEVFLLTETAASFFARLGFLPVTRSVVPAALRASVEFATACPASAQAMSRPLDERPDGGEPFVRAAAAEDADTIARIYNAGIEDRVATFETRLRTPHDVIGWFDGRHPTSVVVAGAAAGVGRVVAFASTSAYRPRACYAGVAEFSVYVDRDHRRAGLGRLAMDAIIAAAARAGFWKLVSRVFVENTASRRLAAATGFREVGVYERHARLDGHWRDVVIVERLLPDPSR